MVDSIGASHVSGESLLFARADDVGARAILDSERAEGRAVSAAGAVRVPVEGAARQDRA